MIIFKLVWDLRLLDSWIMGVILKRCKTSPDLLQLFWLMLQHCLALKLQKCLVDYYTFHLHGGEMKMN